ncbi:lipocalin family protein [Streptomyces sp. NPDC053431]|uniref:lipocalin family protein n=1 Tax=Streptomyces sp. NPDC053431 TaxID=3365703 RepID=UPI0037CE4F79
MSLRDVRAVTRVVGRRTALRYLALGVGASLVAACKSESTTDGPNGITGGQPAPTVTGRALAAFMRGTWSVTAEIGNEDPATFTAVIDDGVWTLNFGEGQSSKGTWALSGGRLSLQVPERIGSEDQGDMEEAAATNLPASFGDSLSLLLPWQPPGASGSSGGENLSVDYANNVLRVRHIEGDNTNTFTCTRA